MAETLASYVGMATQPDMIGAVKQGMGLAQAAGQLQEQKQQLEQQRETLETAKFNKAISSMNTLARFRPEIAKKMIPRVQEQLNASGIPMDSTILEALASDESYRNRFMAISDMISKRGNDPAVRAAGMQAFSDFGAFDQGLEAMLSQQKNEYAAEMAAQKASQANAGKQGTQDRHEQKVDINFQNQIRKDVNDLAVKYEEKQTQFDSAEAAIDTNDLGTLKTSITNFARGVGNEKGPLSDHDVQSYLPSTYAKTVEELKFRLGNDATIPDNVKAPLRTVLAIAREKSAKQFQRTLDRKRKTYAIGESAHLMDEGAPGDVMFKSAYETMGWTPENRAGSEADTTVPSVRGTPPPVLPGQGVKPPPSQQDAAGRIPTPIADPYAFVGQFSKRLGRKLTKEDVDARFPPKGK